MLSVQTSPINWGMCMLSVQTSPCNQLGDVHVVGPDLSLQSIGGCAYCRSRPLPAINWGCACCRSRPLPCIPVEGMSEEDGHGRPLLFKVTDELMMVPFSGHCAITCAGPIIVLATCSLKCVPSLDLNEQGSTVLWE